MNSSRPYLVRAFFEWILDNELTPYLVINTQDEAVEVPKAYIEEGRIILNISPDSVRNLFITNDYLEFSARFGGVEHAVYAPIRSVQAIYAKENGRGMVFKEEDGDDGDEGGGGPSQERGSSKDRAQRKRGKPILSIVK